MAITAPTLSITDSENGGGVTATLAGGNDAADNLVKYVRNVNELGALSWSNLGFRTGPGNVTGTLTKGYYLWHCISTLGAESVISNLVYQNLSGDDAVHQQCLDAIEAVVDALALTGINGVEQQKTPDEMRIRCDMPAVIITPYGRPETMQGGTNQQDDLGYPVYIVFMMRDPDDQSTQARTLLWRQQVSRAIRNQRLAGVSEVHHCVIEPDPVLTMNPADYSLIASAMLVRCVARELRGFGV